MTEPINVLCISSAVKGQRCMQEFKRQGCNVYLLTEERWRNDDWPHDSLDGTHYMHSLADRRHVINTVAWMNRGMKIDLIHPLDEYEIETAAVLREHLQMPGIDASQTRVFNDKLAMRIRAKAAGIPVPDFSSVFNYDDLRMFIERMPPPWLLKPRNEAGSMGIKRCENAEQVWRHLDELGDQQSFFLLEKFMPSDVFHIDSVIWNGDVLFTIASAYGKPPLTVSHGGGVFTSRTLDTASPEAMTLKDMNKWVIQTLGMRDGVTHIEFLRTQADGKYLFLEAAARVGGANLSDMIEYATGVNMWEEWAKLVLAKHRGVAYSITPTHDQHAGILVCLSKVEQPDLSHYDDPEVKWRMPKKYHAGVIVASKSARRIETLLDDYARRFADEFLTRAQPMETGRMV